MIFGAVIDPSLDGEVIITVIATGFGQPQSGFRVIEGRRAAAAAAAASDDAAAEREDALRRPAWERHRDRAQWGRRGEARGESLEVPTFLRKQMD